MADQSDVIGMAISAGIMGAGIAYAWSARRVRDWMVRRMQKESYVRILQVTGCVIALMGFLGLVAQAWTIVRDRLLSSPVESDRSDHKHRNNDASLFGAASGPVSDSN